MSDPVGPATPWPVERVLTGSVADDQATELAFAQAMLRRTDAGLAQETVRIYRPTRNAVVFSRRDTRSPGFARAVRAAREAGFQTAVRAVGGRAVAYTVDTVVVDHVAAETQAVLGQEHRFVTFGRMFVDALRALGADARLGPVPGEYCPGAYSVNAGGETKLVGTAQRVLRASWLFSSLVVVDGEEVLRPVLGEVYRALEVPFEESSVGGLASEVPRLGVGTVADTLRSLFRGLEQEARSDLATRARADELIDQHRVDPG
ncbi:MAG: lipoate--protein ligase family protein [Nocardioides sp.]|uniref:lipoyl protein ligase domain-containing protein n=1 Tax=Nocardioides sp. TaxID=35761 RepID=UPI0039E3996E